VAIFRDTLRRQRRLANEVGRQVDDDTRAVTGLWVGAWAALRDRWASAGRAIADRAAQLGRWPSPWDLHLVDAAEIARRDTAVAVTQVVLEATVRLARTARTIVETDVAAEPGVIGSQFPSAHRARIERTADLRVQPSALEVIIARSREQITALARPLPDDVTEAIRRELVRGVRVDVAPEVVAHRIVDSVHGALNGGLGRMLVIARTELADAYRTAAAYVHKANRDILAGWCWLSSLDVRCCPACWAMHGRRFPLDQAGPWDHQQGRCTRLPVARSWADLGLGEEPPDLVPNARDKFNNLPVEDQLRILGPARLAMLRDGRIGWDDLAVLRDTPAWRPSWRPATVRALART
jgi:hypothetical protein